MDDPATSAPRRKLCLHVGVKSDPIESRYSFPWLFRLMREEGVARLQLGTFFEIYHLPDTFFVDLRRCAEDFGIHIESVFTSHRELGGFYRDEPGWAEVAESNFRRLIEVGALLGAASVGSNPGSVLRDRMATKADGIARYLEAMKRLMGHAAGLGVARLTMEPMSCLAEPPTLSTETLAMIGELEAYHRENAATTASVGLCVDVSHGYADEAEEVVSDHLSQLRDTLPYVTELHLKNTDAVFGSTFGFTPDELRRGVVNLYAVRELLISEQERLPVDALTGFLEIGGPKLGRDYSDRRLEAHMRGSLRHCLEAFGGYAVAAARSDSVARADRGVMLAPSIMCADALHLQRAVCELEQAGADLLHFDIMDARFTPNMPLGLGAIEAARSATSLPFDVHLMVADNDFFVDKLADLDVQYVSVHVESSRHLDRTLSRIRQFGMLAGAALNPATPLSVLSHVLDRLDFVLLMSVNPGYAGQPLVPSAIGKIAECRRLLATHGVRIPIQIDGNVSFENIPRMVAAGADILVCGSSSLFAAGATIASNAATARAAAREGLRRRDGG